MNRGCVLSLLAASACGRAAAHDVRHGGANGELPPALARSVERARSAPPKDKNLYDMRLSLDALQLGNEELARRTLERVFASLNTVFGDTENARKARSRWYSESSKDFKGEPYERAMVGYYLGLTHLRRNDFGNAQAAFRFGAFQDAIAEEAQHASDFALLYYLQALALLRQDPETVAANDALSALARLRPDLAPPDPTKNVLIVVETGKSPRKVTDGVGHNILRFFRGRGFRENGAVARIDGTDLALYPIEDIWWQAATRGGRVVDGINRGKVEFRERMDNIGTVLTHASMIAIHAGSGDAATIGGAVTAVGGAAALIVAANTDAAADDRHWDNLPDAVHVAQASLAPGRHDIQVSFSATSAPGKVPPPHSLTIDVRDSGLTVVWLRSREQIFGATP